MQSQQQLKCQQCQQTIDYVKIFFPENKNVIKQSQTNKNSNLQQQLKEIAKQYIQNHASFICQSCYDQLILQMEQVQVIQKQVADIKLCQESYSDLHIQKFNHTVVQLDKLKSIHSQAIQVFGDIIPKLNVDYQDQIKEIRDKIEGFIDTNLNSQLDNMKQLMKIQLDKDEVQINQIKKVMGEFKKKQKPLIDQNIMDFSLFEKAFEANFDKYNYDNKKSLYEVIVNFNNEEFQPQQQNIIS